MWNFKSESLFSEALKSVSDHAKKYGPRFSQNWKYYVDWHLLTDFKPELKIEDFEEDIRDWVTGDVVHEVDGSEEKFLALFRRGVKRALRSGVRVVDRSELHTVREWSEEPTNWATSGSTSRDRVSVLVEGGGVRKVRKNKWGSAANMSTDDVVSAVHLLRKQENTAIQKRERGKVRAVISGDLETYLKMSYVSHWLDKRLEGSELSTLWMGSKRMDELWTEMSEATERRSVHIPIDQTQFDHNVNLSMIMVMLDEISQFAAEDVDDLDVRAEILGVMEKIKYSLDGGTVLVGSKRFDVTKGVMSGWRWTALLDTLANIGEFEAAAEVVRVKYGTPSVLRMVAQGDDDLLEVGRWCEAVGFWKAYVDMNFLINASKFWIEEDRDEFLRQVAEPGSVSGYPIRAAGSIVWRNPTSQNPRQGELRIREQVHNWNLYLSRNGTPHKTEHMIEDIRRANDISKESVERILHTPASQGGGGYGVHGSTWTRIEPGKSVPLSRPAGTWSGALSLSRVVAPRFPETERLKASQQYFYNNIQQPANVKTINEPDTLKDVPYMFTLQMGNGVNESDMLVPLHPKSAPGVGPSKREIDLRLAKRAKDWQWIEEVWLQPEDREKSRRIRVRGGLRVWLKWLDGRWPINAPVIPGWSDTRVALSFQKFVNTLAAAVMNRSRYNLTTLRRLGQTAEAATRHFFSRQRGVKVVG
jgi:hypothetical protein